jgi:protein-S-isoprenylcysteine O-methyltransferase Ste14
MKTLSILGYVGMIGVLIALAVSRELFSRAPAVIALQVVGAALFLWARVTFGRRSYHVVADPTAGGLVTSGPYRYIRHPIYAGLLLVIAAGMVANGSPRAYLLGSVALMCALVRIYCEEKLVAERYPEYRAYAARTWRLAPLLF